MNKITNFNNNFNDWEQLRKLVKKESFEFGKFVLSSGKESTYYFDGKKVTLSPVGAHLLSKIIIEKIKDLKIDAVGGLTIGADPIVGAVAVSAFLAGLNDLKLFIVRKEPKKHGKCKYIEGPPLKKGYRVVIVDDVITTGGSIIKAIKQVTDLGCEVVKVIALVDREEGGTEAIQKINVEVDPVFRIGDFIQNEQVPIECNA